MGKIAADISATGVDWRTLSQAALDDGFNSAKAVEAGNTIVDGWFEASKAFRANARAELDLPYGPRDRNRIDFFPADRGRSTLIFIHGGYWQMRSKDHFAWLTEGALAHGVNIALIGYTLAPQATLDEIVAEIHLALDFLQKMFSPRGLNANEVVLAGWSAGGHLTAMAQHHQLVKAAIGISGLYDLEPIRHSYINAKLGLDEAASLRNSPMLNGRMSAKPTCLVVGGGELPLMRQQTAEYAAFRASNHLPVRFEEIPDANHFSIMRELAAPNGRIMKLVLDLLNDQKS